MAKKRINASKRKMRMRFLTAAGLLLGILYAGAGCAKEAPAENGMQDIVPENGSAPDGTFGSGSFDNADSSKTSGSKDAEGTRQTAQVGRLTLTLPNGFYESTTGGLYLNQNYPDDQSNIYIYTTEKTTDFAQVMEGGQEQFVKYLADAYEEQYEERPEITMTRYEAAPLWNYSAYVAELSYDLKDVHYVQLEYIVDADKTYYIAFSQVGSALWTEAFYESAQTIFFSETE